MAMTKDNKMALGMCFWPSSASSAAVPLASKILLILLIIGLGIFYIDTRNYDPFMPAGFGPVLTSAATVFFAVEGPCAEAQDEGHQQADQDCRDVDDPAVLRACGNRKWEVDPEAVEEASR
jgi:hypothetical protein